MSRLDNPYSSPAEVSGSSEKRSHVVERSLILAAVVYTAVYVPCFLIAVLLGDERILVAILPFHFVGMLLNFIALVLTFRDLYLRQFDGENAKVTWLLLVLLTGGVGWLVYVFKYALKPRSK